MFNRMMRAVQADVTLYEEAEHTPALQQEAYTIVGIVAAINAIFGFLGGLITSAGFVAALMNGLAAGFLAFAGYLLWSFLIHYVGTSVFKGTGDRGEVQRAVAYAWSPQVLAAPLQLIPCLGSFAMILVAVWSAYLGFVATRQSLDLDNQNAAITVGIAFLGYIVLSAIVFFIVGLVTAGLAGAANAVTG